MAIFDEKIEIGERCKGVDCVDLGESFPTSICMMKSASIQPRTSPSEFGGKFNSLFIRLLRSDQLLQVLPRRDQLRRRRGEMRGTGRAPRELAFEGGIRLRA